jgi:two-component system, OmpR family, sensor histidine kinase ChvG
MAITIRTKFISIFIILFIAFAGMGIYYLGQIEDFLRQEKARELEVLACRVAEIVAGHPGLFLRADPAHASSMVLPALFDRLSDYNPLYVYPLRKHLEWVNLDGDASEWLHGYKDFLHHYNEEEDQGKLLYQFLQGDDDFLSFKHMLAKDDGFLYALFVIKDAHIIKQKMPERIDGDHLQILMESASDRHLRRYVLPLPETGELTFAHRIPLQLDNECGVIEQEVQIEPLISGAWRANDEGYTLEFRIPLNFIGSRIGFAVADVDDRQHGVRALLSTAEKNAWKADAPPLLEHYLDDAAANERNLYVLDRQGKKSQFFTHSETDKGAPPNLWQKFIEWIVCTEKKETFVRSDGEELLKRVEISAALDETRVDGNNPVSHSVRYLDATPGHAIRAAACPVFMRNFNDDERLIGAVVLEQTEPRAFIATKPVLLKILLWFSLGVAIPGLFLWFMYASLGQRLRRLRGQAEKALGMNGMVQPEHIILKDKDELGDVARSFAKTLCNLKQHHQYLQSMAGRLAHELRTPIAVVRSSLENLEQEEDDAQKHVYLERAVQGIDRLRLLISALTEATRLEQAVQREEREIFDLTELVAGCGENYRMIYPCKLFYVTVPDTHMMMEGTPEMIVQMLDKLIANAVDFALPDTPIEISLRREPDHARLEVANQGPPLPLEMRDRLFESMVSVRAAKGKTDEPHLGLGLYIVRLIVGFHGGTVRVGDHPLGGALFTLRLPFKPSPLPGPTVVST